MSYACRSVNDIKANQERLKEILKSYEKIRRDKTEDVIRDILERDFPKKNLSEDLMGLGAEAEDHRREAAQDVLSRGIEDVQKNYRQAKKETLETWGDLLGVSPYLEYQPQGTAVIETNEGSGWESKRISNNEVWYRDFYKENKKAPTQRQRYDIVHEEFMKEFEEQARNDPEAEEALKEAKAAKARVEALEELDGYFKSLDVRDILARKTLSEDAYNVYLPMMEALHGANSDVLEASRDSALVYARMLDVAAKKYSTPDHPITARDLAARIQIGGRAQGYGQYMSPEEKLAWDEKEWAKTLNDIENWNGPTRPVRVMHTPLIMQMIGAKNLPVYMDVSKIKRIEKEHPDMTREVLQQIPRALTDPIIMFSSRTRPGRMVAVLELKAKNGANVVVPFVLDVEKNWVQANVIASAYPKGDQGTNFRWMQEQVRNGNLLYADRNRAEDVLGTDREKAIDLLVSAGVQFPMEPKGNDGISKRKIPDESDLVKYKNARPSYYQMAGERAETAPLAKLEEAKAMQASGEGENAIWKKTGWMMGKDGKWRWEIPDNMDGIDVSAVRSMKEGDATVLGLIYDNDALYEAYPRLANVFVRAGDLGEKIYGAAREGNRIYINTKSEDVEIKNTLIHEIQHVIQYYEGFAIGGNPASLAGGYREYRNLAGEQEARNTADRAEAVNNAVKAEREAWKKVIDMRSQLEETAKNMDDESKKKILELADTKIDIREKREIPGDEVLDRIDELEAWMKETAPQSVKDAYEAFDDALWDHGGAMNEREWQEKRDTPGAR